MRRGISIAMVIFGLLMLASGITKLFPPFDTTFHPGHVANSFIFTLLVVIHIWLNRKPIIRYFKGLKWWWILVGLGLATVIWIGVGLPILLT